jgi:DNA-binding NarL/FixJ family response regulator
VSIDGGLVHARVDAATNDGLRIVVLEQNEVARRGLQEMFLALCAVPGAPHVATVRSVSSFVPDDAVHLGHPSVLIVPSDIGSAAAALVCEALRPQRVLVVIRNAEPGQLAAAIRLNAHGFLMEPTLTLDVLARALHQILGGEVPMPAALARRVLEDASRDRGGSDRFPMLTPRESEVLGLLVDGLSNKQIANALRISDHGAKRHVANVLMKLNCPNRTLAVARAIHEGLIARPVTV